MVHYVLYRDFPRQILLTLQCTFGDHQDGDDRKDFSVHISHTLARKNQNSIYRFCHLNILPPIYIALKR